MPTAFKVGQKLKAVDGKEGKVRYIGPLHFTDGEWIGLELTEPLGKNNGTVRGETYFSCQENHGIFYKASTDFEVIEEPKANGKSAVPTSKTRPPSVGLSSTRSRPTSSAVTGKRSSTIPSTPTAIQAPGKRQSLMPPPSATATTRTSRLSLAPRTASPTKKPSRQSFVGVSTAVSRTTSQSPTKPPTSQANLDGVIKSPLGHPTSKHPTSVARADATSVRTTLNRTKSVEEEAKNKVLEKQLEKGRAENKERLRELEQLREENGRYKEVNEKLQAKCKTQHQEITELRKKLKETEERFEQIENIQAEHDSLMELAALDREMAEEKAEAAQAELDSVKQKLEELELEVEILKEENEELSKDMSPEERASQGWLQMQRENERLREALLRLRDWSQEQEAQLKDDIKGLEEDSQELSTLRGQHEEAKTRLLETEAEIEDLREQLDAALNAEAMIEQLTERNLSMAEQLEELRNTVEDLQSLKELNDELELNHIENEKQLQEVIDFKDAIISDQTRRMSQQDEELNDKDYTILRFRELVTNLQSDLEDMRASKEMTESEAQQLGNHSKAMMDLNRQLQASATSTKLKTIDMELRKMEAEEASDHLAIVQLFLPEAFHVERDSVLALLRFKRVAFKSRLLHNFIKERLSTHGHTSQGDQLLAACDVLDKLTWMSAMCDRFSNSISTSSLEQFSKFESTLLELEPVERSLNGYIENLRKDELREQYVVDGLHRSIAVMRHLSELHLRDDLENYAEEVLMKTLLMQSNLETTAAALMISKSEIAKVATTSAEEDEEVTNFVRRIDTFITQTRSAKVISGKVYKALQELKVRNLALDMDSAPTFEACAATTEDLTDHMRQLSQSISSCINDEEFDTVATFADIISTIRAYNTQTFHSSDPDVLAPFQSKLRIIHERLSEIFALSSDLSQTVEFDRVQPPWVLRSKELQASKIVSVDAETEIQGLKREVSERVAALRLRDEYLDEANLKIEMLEARMRDVGKKASRITELEAALAQANARIGGVVREVEEQVRRGLKVQEERDRWMRKATELQASVKGDAADGLGRAAGLHLVGTSAEMEALRCEIKVLESTCRYLRQQTRRNRAEEDVKENSWLMTPLVPPKTSKRVAMEEERKQSMTALEKLAKLPETAQPIRLSKPAADGKRLAWQPMRATPQWQLCEQELRWLRAWNPENRKISGSKMFWFDVQEQLIAVS
jgi:dynactin 1